jgi:LacI family transcriptional regulator
MVSPRRRAPTMKDVARRAQVDPSVVSRFLSGDPALNVSDATRERVADAVRELGYRRNAVARGLRMSRTRSIGYLIPDLVSPSNEALIAGAQRAASAHDYVVIIGSTDGDSGTAEAFGRLFGEGRVDGLLVNTGVMSDEQVLELAAGPEPVVLVNRSVRGAACSVIIDDEAAARLATRHLTDLGHRQIAHVAGPSVADTFARRQTGFLETAKEVAASGVVVSASAWDSEAGLQAAEELLADHPETTAIFAANVMIGIGVLRAASERGLSVPADLSVVVMHDATLATMTLPAMTAVATPLEALGAVATERLIARINGETVPKLTVVTEPPMYLEERASTAELIPGKGRGLRA